MSTPHLNLDALRNAIVNPTGGVVGLVDNVLTLCRAHRLQLDWRPDRCSVRSANCAEEAIIDVPLRKSVFRAVIARVATLCSEENPESFSPYGGEGGLSAGSQWAAVIRVAWVNTPDEQRLGLAYVELKPFIPNVEATSALESGRHAEA